MPDASLNVYNGRIEITGTGSEDTDILVTDNGRMISLQNQTEPWGVDETEMTRADELLLSMGWYRTSEWERPGDEFVCTVGLLDFCEYIAAHMMEGVRATRVIDCGRVGLVPACESCVALYQRLKR